MCRVALWVDGERLTEGEAPGPSGLADEAGARQAVLCMRQATSSLPLTEVDAVVAGLAGLLSAPGRAATLLHGLAKEYPGSQVLVTSDAVTSHAGALSGRTGVVLAAGTGVTAIGISAAGSLALVDGWGYLLGDAGSGIGRAGLDLALRQADGRGGSANLHQRAARRWGQPRGIPAQIHGSANPAREVASFATEVFAAAQDGDAGALGICEDAAHELALSVAAATRRSGAPPEDGIATIGGLLNAGPILISALDRYLTQLLPGVARRPAEGDALAGGHLIATRSDLPHHRINGALTTKREPR